MTRRPPRRAWAAVCAAILAAAWLLAVPVLGVEAAARRFEAVEVPVMAVLPGPQGPVGVALNVTATVLEAGTGTVYVSTRPATDADLAASARIAARAAADAVGKDWRGYDFLVSFDAGAPMVGGSSAGAAIAAAFAVALHNLEERDSWTLGSGTVTGAINANGVVAPVAGLPEKIEAAARHDITTLLYPAGMDRGSTVRTMPSGLHRVDYDVPTLCAEAGIVCQNVTHLHDVLRAWAGIAIPQPDRALEPGPVQAEVRILAESEVARLSDLLSLAQADQGADAFAHASLSLEEAYTAMAQGAHLRAAAIALRGQVAIQLAQDRQALAGAEPDRVVADALARCAQGVRHAANATDAEATALGRFHILAMAQASAAAAMQAESAAHEARFRASSTGNHSAALEAATECTAHARLAMWWMDVLPVVAPGPSVDDRVLAQRAVDEAMEMVDYAQAVAPGRSAAPGPHLQQARSMMDTGSHAGATVAAYRARAYAMAVVQDPDALGVPVAVLELVGAEALRDIDLARSSGIEPLAAISEIEAVPHTSADVLVSRLAAQSLASMGFPDASASRPSGWPPPGSSPEPTRSAGTHDAPGAAGGASLLLLTTLALVRRRR